MLKARKWVNKSMEWNRRVRSMRPFSRPLFHARSHLPNLRSEMVSTLSKRKSVNGFTEKPLPPLLPYVAPQRRFEVSSSTVET